MIRFLRLPEVCSRVGLCPMTIWRKEHTQPPSFPLRLKIGANAVAWVEDEIEAWCEERVADRNSRRNQKHGTGADSGNPMQPVTCDE